MSEPSWGNRQTDWQITEAPKPTQVVNELWCDNMVVAMMSWFVHVWKIEEESSAVALVFLNRTNLFFLHLLVVRLWKTFSNVNFKELCQSWNGTDLRSLPAPPPLVLHLGTILPPPLLPSPPHPPAPPWWWCDVSRLFSNEQAVMDEVSTAVFVAIQKFYYPLLCILGIPGGWSRPCPFWRNQPASIVQPKSVSSVRGPVSIQGLHP